MIEAEGDDHLKKLEQCPALMGKELLVEKPEKKSPRVMIYEVKNEDETTKLKDMYEQNLKDSDISVEEFRSNFTCVHKYKERDPNDSRENWVVECCVSIRNLLRRKYRIFIGWQSCCLKDYSPLTCCYNCQACGHVAEYCKNKLTCSHCAEEHKISNCPNKNKPPRCPNCLAQKKDCNHPHGSPKCPEYIRANKIPHEQVNYGH